MAAEKGNKYAQEWTLENALPRFEDALKYAEENEECLCLQDAIFQSGIPSRTFYQLSKDQIVLQTIKEDIAEAIIRRVNRDALNKFTASPASPAIWRMKQLGERDEQHINTTGNLNQNIVVTDAKAAEEIQRLKDKFENE